MTLSTIRDCDLHADGAVNHCRVQCVRNKESYSMLLATGCDMFRSFHFWCTVGVSVAVAVSALLTVIVRWMMRG